MGLSISGQGNDGSRVEKGGEVRPPLPEYHHPVYCHLEDTGDMPGDGALARSAGGGEIVGSGQP